MRISSQTSDHPWEDGLPAPLVWDGTTWGSFELSYVSQPMLDLVYRRLDADGDVVLGPVTVLAPADSHVADIVGRLEPETSKYGLAWTEIRDTDIDVYFQVMEESTGALEGSATHLDDYVAVIGTYGFSTVADGTGWAVAWIGRSCTIPSWVTSAPAGCAASTRPARRSGRRCVSPTTRCPTAAAAPRAQARRWIRRVPRLLRRQRTRSAASRPTAAETASAGSPRFPTMTACARSCPT